MANDIPPIHESHFKMALLNAVKARWLRPIEHGYCFHCNKEGAVFEVIAQDAPAQPPRCEQCFIKQAFNLLENDRTVSGLMQKYDDGLP
jgi:hypothetical protein